MKKIIIFGAHGYNTMGVIECFAINKIPFFLLLIKGAKSAAVTHKSRFVTSYHIVNSIDKGIDFLEKNRDYFHGAIIYPTGDGIESSLDKKLESLSVDYIFPNARIQGRVTLLMDKKIQYDYASEAGLDVPYYETLSKEDYNKEIKYPCIVKPLKSIEGGKEDISICNNKGELCEATKYAKFTQRFIVQQYIKKDYDLLLIGCSLPNGTVLIPGGFKKERWSPFCGDGSFGKIFTDVERYFDKITELKDYVKNLNYYGPFSVEFGHYQGKNYFFEINLRNDGTSHYFHKAGIFIPYIYYLACQDINYAPSFQKNEYTFIDEFSDIFNVVFGKVKFSKWLCDFRKASTYKYYNKNDKCLFARLFPKMLLAEIYHFMRVIFKLDKLV